MHFRLLCTDKRPRFPHGPKIWRHRSTVCICSQVRGVTKLNKPPRLCVSKLLFSSHCEHIPVFLSLVCCFLTQLLFWWWDVFSTFPCADVGDGCVVTNLYLKFLKLLPSPPKWPFPEFKILLHFFQISFVLSLHSHRLHRVSLFITSLCLCVSFPKIVRRPWD